MTFTAKHTTLAALILGLLATAMPFVTDAASQCDRDVYPAPWTLSQWRACGLARADADRTALAALEERLSGITLLPAALRAQVTFEISLNKQNVANMRARIDDADTIEVIKPLVNDIARNYRVRGLVVPKLNVLITAESARFTVDKLTTTHDALKARVDKAAAAGKNVTTMRTYLELMLGSIQSAKASAESASAKVQGLTPDMGDKAKANSNRQAIFEGRAYIVANKASFAAANDYAAKIREWLRDNTVVANGSLSVSPATGKAPLAVAFTATLRDGGNYRIDFGDGTSGALTVCQESYPMRCPLNHTYQNAGTYTARLTKGGTQEDTVRVTVSTDSTSGDSLTATPSGGTVPLQVSLSGRIANPSTYNQYIINFGDGSTSSPLSVAIPDCADGTCDGRGIVSASHKYEKAGTFTATLSGYVACFFATPVCAQPEPPVMATAKVTVNSVPTATEFDVTPKTGNAPLTVTATFDIGSPCSAYTLTWGDGSNSNQSASSQSCTQVVTKVTKTHTYSNSGIYTVSFQTGGGGTKTAAVVVGAATATISITSIESPAQLSVNQSGTWKVHVSTTASTTPLNYTVSWDDSTQQEVKNVPPSGSTSDVNFTHTYTRAGTFIPRFTVKDTVSGYTVTGASIITVTSY